MMEEPASVLLVDALNFRRAGIERLLRDWADQHHVVIRQWDPDQIAEDEDEGQHHALCVVILGSLSVEDPKPSEWISLLISRFPTTPLVVVSDRMEAEEAVSAFQAGARGFLPTTTAPDVAMHALSFIMGGGTFFPPGALIASSGRPASGRRPSVRRRPGSKGDSDSQGDLRTLLWHNGPNGADAGEELHRHAQAIIGLDSWRVRRAGAGAPRGGKPVTVLGGQGHPQTAILLFPQGDRTRGG